MNKENVLKVADAIEQHSIPELGFNMNYGLVSRSDNIKDLSGYNCDTVACIAGWCNMLTKPDARFSDFDAAREFLGLDPKAASELFYASSQWEFEGGDHTYLERITPSKAAVVLRHLAETGEVNWSVA